MPAVPGLVRDDQLSAITNVRLPRSHPLSVGLVDVVLRDGLVIDIAPAGALAFRGRVLDGDGSWILPGFWDHHLHVTAWALENERVPLTDSRGPAEAARLAGEAHADLEGRVIGVGFRDALWAEAPSLETIDARTGETPTYLINADLHSCWLNSAAFRREGITPTADGVLREEAAFDVTRRLGEVSETHRDAAVQRACETASSRGITGIVDLDMDWNLDAWMRRIGDGWMSARVRFGIYPDHLDRALALGMRSGDALPGGLVQVGAVKIIADGSLGTRTAACSRPYPDGTHGVMNVSAAELDDLALRATGGGLELAIHAIGDEAASAALDVFARVGGRGTIEHAQLISHRDLLRFGRLGVTASVQPSHAGEDVALAQLLWSEQSSVAYPLRSLVEAGANVVFGSDGPVSTSDPRAWMMAATARVTSEAPPFAGAETIARGTALAAAGRRGTSGSPVISIGHEADLVLVDSDPFESEQWSVRATIVDGIDIFVAA